MSDILAAEDIISKIKNNEHYNCFSKNEYKQEFDEECGKVIRIRECYYDLEKKGDELIRLSKQEKNETELFKNKQIEKEKELKIFKNNLKKNNEIVKKEYDNQINEIKNNYNITIETIKNENILLDKDIENLKTEIDILEKKYMIENDNIKKEEQNKIINEYKLKLINYENEKKLEKIKKENEILLAKAEREKQKEIEFNELKNKAELVKKITGMVLFINNSN